MDWGSRPASSHPQIPARRPRELIAATAGGEEGPCGWLKDRYGLSWQIIPTDLPALLNDPDPVRAQRVMAAMLGMKKLDIAALQTARHTD